MGNDDYKSVVLLGFKFLIDEMKNEGNEPFYRMYFDKDYDYIVKNIDTLSVDDLQDLVKEIYIDYNVFSHRYMFDEKFSFIITQVQQKLINDIKVYKGNALNNKLSSVCSNTLKRRENSFMSENKKYEYVERTSLTIPENCIAKRKDGSIIYLEKGADGQALPIQKVFIVLPQRNGENFRRKFTIPVSSVFSNQIKEFKTISLSKAINKETNQEMKFNMAYEKKGEDGKWVDCSKDFPLESRSLTFEQLVSLIKDLFKNLNAQKEVDGKMMPAVHYMWLPQNAHENQNDASKNIPTCRVVPEINAKTGEKNVTAGDIEITLPTYAKIHDFKVFDYNSDNKTFSENANTQKLNLNFAKFFVPNTYSSSNENKEGLIGIMMPDNSKIRITIAKHEGKDGKVYEGGTYFINANDLREAIKSDYKDYKKAHFQENNNKAVGDIKKDLQGDVQKEVDATKEITKESTM